MLIFRESCRFEPLVQKLQRTKTPVTTISALMEIAGRYAGSDPTKDDSDGEHDACREIERHRDNRRNGGRDNRDNGNSGKRKSHGGSELVAYGGQRNNSR